MTILPTYKCNFHCDFCFFNMYRDKKDKQELLLDLDKFEDFLKTTDNITELVIIGGEPFLLPDGYLARLVDICYNHINEPIDVYTNFSLPVPKDIDFDKTRIVVGYDPHNRIMQNKVLANMLKSTYDFAVSIIATKELIEEWGAHKVVAFANKLKKKICICNYEMVPGNEWSHRPTPQEFATFSMELAKSGCEYIEFNGMNAFRQVPHNKNEKDSQFETHVMVTPDMRFSYQTNGVNKTHRFSNTYEEAKRGFYNTYKNNNVCIECKYNNFCSKMYVKNNKCEYDKIVMNIFDKQHKEDAK